MSWMSDKTGRPKEEGGHKRINISINDFTDKALDKIRKGGNVSRFIEKQLRPVLENLDPGEASIHVWRIEAYLGRQIIKAVKKDKPELAQTLGSLATAIKDFRDLCGISPPGFWGDDEAEHVQKPFHMRKKEPLILTLISVLIISIFGFFITNDLSKTALKKMGNQTGMEMARIVFQVTPYIVLVPAIAVVVAVLLMARHTNPRRLLFSGFGD